MNRTPRHLFGHVFSFLALSLLSVLLTTSCKASDPLGPKGNGTPPDTLVVAFYNVENLFDTLVSGPGDTEFLPNKPKQWNSARYATKLANLSRVLGEMDGGKGPDLFGLCEVENEGVVQDLIKQNALKSRTYKVVHEESPDFRGIDVALVYDDSRFELLSKQVIRIDASTGFSFTSRDILLATLRVKQSGDTLIAGVCHWPSRQNPANYRIQVATKVRQTLDAIWAKSPKRHIILMGDLNDTPQDTSFIQGLGAEPIAPQAVNASTPNDLYSATGPLSAGGYGTHRFNGTWHQLDNFVVSYSLLNPTTSLRWVGEPVIYKPDYLLVPSGPAAGNPARTYGGSDKYYGGYSDHLPIYGTFIVK